MSYTIRQVATQFHMQPSTLRYYEDQGLLTNVYESNEPEHIDEILDLLESRRESLDEQRRALNEAAMHVQRKLHYYGDIKRAIDAGEDWPDWREYKNRAYSIEC